MSGISRAINSDEMTEWLRVEAPVGAKSSYTSRTAVGLFSATRYQARGYIVRSPHGKQIGTSRNLQEAGRFVLDFLAEHPQAQAPATLQMPKIVRLPTNIAEHLARLEATVEDLEERLRALEAWRNS